MAFVVSRKLLKMRLLFQSVQIMRIQIMSVNLIVFEFKLVKRRYIGYCLRLKFEINIIKLKFQRKVLFGLNKNTYKFVDILLFT